MSEQTKSERVHQVFEKISDQYDSMNSVITLGDISHGAMML